MQIVSIGDNLHEMSNLVFWKKLEKCHQFVICWFSLESGKVKIIALDKALFFLFVLFCFLFAKRIDIFGLFKTISFGYSLEVPQQGPSKWIPTI